MTTEKLGVLFCDICDSSGLYERHGVAVASEFIEVCLAKMVAVVETCGGEVIDQIGDEVFCQFGSCDAMAICARQLIERLGTLSLGDTGEYAQVRVGFYYGKVLVQGKKRYGEVVHTAKRMIDLAKPRQILSTAAVLQQVSGGVFFHRHVNDYVIKGSARHERVHELLWDQTELTLVTPAMDMLAGQKRNHALAIQWQGGAETVSPENPKITIGRAEHCDVSIHHLKVSRLHGRIEYRADGFYYIDVSTNGTILKEAADTESLIRQNQVLLNLPCTLQLVEDAAGVTTIHIALAV